MDDMEQLPLVVERDGRRETVIVGPAGRLEPLTSHNNPGRPYWVQYEPPDQTLYVCYRAVVTTDHPPSNVEF